MYQHIDPNQMYLIIFITFFYPFGAILKGNLFSTINNQKYSIKMNLIVRMKGESPKFCPQEAHGDCLVIWHKT